MSKRKFVVSYATDSGNFAEIGSTYRSLISATEQARRIADAMRTVTVVNSVESSFGLRVMTREAVIMHTERVLGLDGDA